MDTATDTRSATGRIELHASPEAVWKALTDAAELVRWFPLEARVEPGEGGSIFMSWKNEHAAESKILAWEPMKRLVTSWGWGDDAESQPQMTEYLIESQGETTILSVVTSGFPNDPSWDAYVEGTNNGWIFELQSLKQYLEGHAGQDRDAVTVRRRTPISAEDAWTRVFSDAGLGSRPLQGAPFNEVRPVQYAAIVDEGIFRVSFEPCGSGSGTESREVALWLQAWGHDRERLPAVEAKWHLLLESLFPEGETL